MNLIKDNDQLLIPILKNDEFIVWLDDLSDDDLSDNNNNQTKDEIIQNLQQQIIELKKLYYE